MAREYRNETDNKCTERINKMLNDLPGFCTSLILSDELSITARTQLEYLQRISVFLRYLTENDQRFSGIDVIHITADDLAELKKRDIELFTHYIITESATGKHKANSKYTANHYLCALTALYDFLIDDEQIDVPNPVKRVKRALKKQKKDIIYLSESEKDQMINVIQNGDNLSKRQKKYNDHTFFRDICITKIFLTTGIRVSELAGLDIDDINFQEHCFPVVRKREKDDIVFFNDEVSDLLMEYIENDRVSYCPTDNERALFLSSMGTRPGKRLSVRSMQKIIQKYAKAAGINKHITPHKLRATCATDLLEKTENLGLVQETLGHDDPKTTLLYSRTSIQQKKKYRNALME